ncbi:MAG: hypothetical protein DI565_07840 [Ancylobacter novellus]|uniref:Type II toxin-antitoxin system RelE/ParE family toxin n=1 Tax=Ancylobacter novellus TaxID=921 RepID=A0A2W5KJ06_ANCNO|nr:MAG: hypothetical protein DI565_07840 [Ancylobacter novellus]
MIVQFTSAALADLRRLRGFLRTVDKGVADAAVDGVLASAATLGEFSFRAPKIRGSALRRLTVPFGRGAYLIDYRVDKGHETVTVVRPPQPRGSLIGRRFLVPNPCSLQTGRTGVHANRSVNACAFFSSGRWIRKAATSKGSPS